MCLRKCHGTQQSLLVMLQICKKAFDNGQNVCTVFMDLSKTFNIIIHDLLLAKLKAYGMNKNNFYFIKSFSVV